MALDQAGFTSVAERAVFSKFRLLWQSKIIFLRQKYAHRSHTDGKLGSYVALGGSVPRRSNIEQKASVPKILNV